MVIGMSLLGLYMGYVGVFSRYSGLCFRVIGGGGCKGKGGLVRFWFLVFPEEVLSSLYVASLVGYIKYQYYDLVTTTREVRRR